MDNILSVSGTFQANTQKETVTVLWDIYPLSS